MTKSKLNKFGVLPIVGAGAEPAAAAPVTIDFNHHEVYMKQIMPLMDQVEAIMKANGMNGFTMFEVSKTSERFKLEGSIWGHNEQQSFQREICMRVAQDEEFCKRLSNVMFILDMPDSDILKNIMGLKQPGIIGSTH